jgi:transcriptional regulator with XRE-family HTH domain
MPQFYNKIREIINQSGLRLNVISKNCGVSHTYLTKLVHDDINRPGKDKIASILLALNYNIKGINDVLAHYDYRPLNAQDIPEILKNNQKRKFEGSTLSLYDHIHMRLMLSPMERIGGDKILVKGTPSVLFMPDVLYLKRDSRLDMDDTALNFHITFNLAIFKERKKIFKECCRAGHHFITYICKKCLEEYLRSNLEGDLKDAETVRHRALVVTFFANAIKAIQLNPQQHQTKIVERCTYFDYMIQGADQQSPKVFFLGRKPHGYENEYQQLNLQGFTSASPSMIALFKKESDLCRRAVVKEFEKDYPDKLFNYLLGLFSEFGLDKELKQAVADGA